MTAKLTPSTRILAIAVVGLVAAFSVLMVLRLSATGGTEAAVATKPATALAKPRPAHSTTRPAAPALVLLPNVPQPVARALRYSKVVVVSLYASPAVGDRPAVAEARAGARQSGAGFVALNAVDERFAKELAPFVGPTSSPAVLVVRRPGRILTRMQGQPDRTVVAQAAHNAGARRG